MNPYSVGSAYGMYGAPPQYSVGSANGMYAAAPQYSVGSANGMYGADGVAKGLDGSGGAGGSAGIGAGGAAMPMLAVLQTIFNMDKENRDRKLASETQRYSPWTQLRAQPIEHANPAGDLAQGYAGYIGQQQNDEAAGLRKKLTEAQIRAIDRYNQPARRSPASEPEIKSPMMDSGHESVWSRAYKNRLGSPYQY